MNQKKCRVPSAECRVVHCDPRSSILVPRVPARRGFSFIEIMFAVILLGIGFIMLAAVFPVGIRQQQETLDADNATAMANMAHAIFHASKYTDFAAVGTPPGTNVNYSTIPILPMSGSQVSTVDPRFAWTMVWRWNTNPPASGSVGEMFYFILKSQNQPAYSSAMVANTIQPQRVGIASVTFDSLGSTLSFAAAGNGPVLAESGAFVVIASTTDATKLTSIGKVYRLASRVVEGNNVNWYLSPDFTPGSTAENLAAGTHEAYMVGKGLRDGLAAPGAGNPYEGPAQDIALIKKTIVVP